MKRAKFIYQLVEYKDRQCIIIEDKKDFFEACNSVTEDIVYVIEQIELREHIRAEDYLIVYRDTALTYDGWNARTQQFIILKKLDWPSAIQKFIYLQLEPQTQPL